MHVYKARVYFSDTDAGGIAYHARFLDWAEHARTEMLRTLLPAFKQESIRNMGFVFVVRSINIDYLMPAYLDDEIRVETEMEKLGAVSGVVHQCIYRDESLLAELRIKVAFIDTNTKKPSRLPDQLIEALS